MSADDQAWYCFRTKHKHEHIAAASVRKSLALEVFYPRLRIRRATRRGIVRLIEPLFPCYVFVRCSLSESLSKVQYCVGINSVVSFRGGVPSVPETVIGDLQR